MTYATASTIPTYTAQQVTPQPYYGLVPPAGAGGSAISSFLPFQAQPGVLAPEDQVYPQEYLVSPMSFWSKVARIGLKHGLPIVRQIISSLEYQQLAPQQVAPQQFEMVPMGAGGSTVGGLAGGALGGLIGGPIGGLAGGALGRALGRLLPFETQPGVLAPEDQVYPQEYLVSPMSFWSKVARIGLKHGLPIVRQIISSLEYQQLAQQQQVAQQQVVPQQYGYGQVAPMGAGGSAIGGAIGGLFGEGGRTIGSAIGSFLPFQTPVGAGI